MNVSIGPEDGERTVTMIVSDEAGWSPDLLEMATIRAATHALWLWRELHPEAVIPS